jgi:type I restriction enzyme R subunit
MAWNPHDNEKMSLEVLDNETKSRAFALVILKMLTQQAGLSPSIN